MPNNLVVSGNLTINGTATYVNTQSISAKDPLFEVANDNNTTDAVDIGYYGRYYDTPQTRVEFTGLFRDASDAGKFKFFTGLVDEPTNVVNTTGTGYTVGTLVANFEGNLAGTANAANALSTARTIAASGDAVWSVSFDGSANVTSALTLANTGVTATTYGTSTAVPTIAIDGKGRITSASNTNITFPVTTVNGFAGTVVLTTTDIAEGTNQYFTNVRAQSAISLTTSGTSGAATYSGGVFNIPTYIGGSGTVNEIAFFSTTGVISSLTTATYPSLTELSYVKGVTSAIQTQLNGKLNLTGGTLTGGLIGTTGSFSSGGSGDTFTIGHTSGSGIALNITKNGNGEGLYINKASGSGNAATIIGTLNATTLVKSGGTASQFLKADGSVDSNAYLPLTGGTLTGALSGTSATFSSSVSVNGATITKPLSVFAPDASGNIRLTRAGTAEYMNIGTYAITVSGNDLQIQSGTGNTLQLNPNGGNVGIGTSSPNYTLHIDSNTSTTRFQITNSTTGQGSAVGFQLLQIANDSILTNRSNGYMSFETAGTERMRITAGGTIQYYSGATLYGEIYASSTSMVINAYSGALLLQASGTTRMSIFGSGNIRFTSVVYNNTVSSPRTLYVASDGEIGGQSSILASKTNIKHFDTNWLYDLKPVQFNYRKKNENKEYTNEFDTELYYGLIAEETELVNKELCTYKDDKLMGIEYSKLVPVLVKAIQEQQAQIEELKAMIAAK
jgi:hypothetical protein